MKEYLIVSGRQCGKTQLIRDAVERKELQQSTQKFLENSVYGLYSSVFDTYYIPMMPIDYSIPSDIGIGSDQLRKLANHGKVNAWENSGYQRGIGTRDVVGFKKAVQSRRAKDKLAKKARKKNRNFRQSK